MAFSKIIICALVVAVAAAFPQIDDSFKDNRKAVDAGFGGSASGLGATGAYNGYNRQAYNPYNPYAQNPYGQNPYSQNPYGQNPYGQNPYGPNPYSPLGYNGYNPQNPFAAQGQYNRFGGAGAFQQGGQF